MISRTSAGPGSSGTGRPASAASISCPSTVAPGRRDRSSHASAPVLLAREPPCCGVDVAVRGHWHAYRPLDRGDRRVLGAAVETSRRASRRRTAERADPGCPRRGGRWRTPLRGLGGCQPVWFQCYWHEPRPAPVASRIRCHESASRRAAAPIRLHLLQTLRAGQPMLMSDDLVPFTLRRAASAIMGGSPPAICSPDPGCPVWSLTAARFGRVPTGVRRRTASRRPRGPRRGGGTGDGKAGRLARHRSEEGAAGQPMRADGDHAAPALSWGRGRSGASVADSRRQTSSL